MADDLNPHSDMPFREPDPVELRYRPQHAWTPHLRLVPTNPAAGCNRHFDCYAADLEAAARSGLTTGPGWRLRAANHCSDEDCEDCFGR